MRYALALALLSGCAASTSYRTQDHFTTSAPTSTVAEALAAADPVLDDSGIVTLPYADPQGLIPPQPVPFPGLLLSEFDAARYRLLDAAADTWRVRAVTSEWQLARTERRDAAYAHVLEDRVQQLQVRAQRRQRWVYVVTGVAVGGIVAAVAGR